ncbi:Excinuclease ABC subunit B [Fibrobacter sp. UWH5]|uniref:excinuclease ABC subunit UvrB n=1 Tax=Fibrobacter sp. UWH5 TaxID=1896211 RepID=UPI00091D0B8A|nr:excinuclease ABC subunit UvrB [Fibrobacter sp. UWH5]SHK88946.1 Excinuclease ABC subunit B [Fibrobacter sp. UWH5]
MARARKTITPDPYAKPIAKVLSPEQSLPGRLRQFQAPTRANFELVSQYAAAGDQPKAIEQITEGFKQGDQFQTLLGVTGSGKTFTMANVIKNVGKPTLILTHNKTLAAQLYQEFKAFFPKNAVEYFVSYYDYFQPEAYIPHTDTFIEKDASINDEIDKLRLRATANLLTRRDVIIIASVSCIYGLGSPAEYFDLMVRIKKGDIKDRDDLLHELVRIQYTRNDFSLERGTFRCHGDVIEIHPSYDEDGMRIELFGDEVDRLVRFNIITGEVIQELDEMTIAPAKHFVTKEEGRAGILQRMQLQLTDRLAELDKEGKVLESARLSSRTRYDMEMIRETGMCSGIENYSALIENRGPGTRPFTLIDYFGDDWLLMVDESHVSIPQVGGMAEGDKSRKTTLVNYGFRLPCALDNRPMNFKEFEYMYPKQVLFVSATPGEYELEKTGGVVAEQINRPTGLLDPKIEMFPIQGQMDVLLYRIDEVVKKGDRVLVTTLTKKMAQDLTDYFVEAGIRAKYLHSDIKTLERHDLIKGLRTGEFDVLVGINLLREGLDLPEVSMVAILDADKEGFLRNYRSLIQTMGRASRNVNGTVLLFADNMTDSLQKAVDETIRRRTLQEEFNKEHGITPKSVSRKLEGDLVINDPLMDLWRGDKTPKAAEDPDFDADYGFADNDEDGDVPLFKGAPMGKPKKSSNLKAMPPHTSKRSDLSIEELEKQMKAAAAKLDFEEAARLRDLIRDLGK